MTETLQHKEAPKGHIHIIHNNEFATLEDRNKFIPTNEDLDKICLVRNPYGFYALSSINPITWEKVGSNPEKDEIYKSIENPTTSINPKEKGVLWVNFLTPEIFICTDNTKDQNAWRGIFSGKIISNSKIFNYDFFKDNSCVSLLTLENEFVNAGTYTITQNNMAFESSASGKGLKAINEKCSIDINGKMKSISFFIYFPTTVPNNNYFYDCRGYGDANTFAYIGTNITLTRIGWEGIYQNGVRIDQGGQFKKNEWVHIAINFSGEMNGVRLLNNNANPPLLGLNGVIIDQIRCFNRALSVDDITKLSKEIY